LGLLDVDHRPLEKYSNPKVDAELRRQLEQAPALQSSVEAVFTLRQAKSLTGTPQRVEETVNELLSRAMEETGLQPDDMNVFRNLGAFVIVAPASFINALLKAPEITRATANRQSDDLEIQPGKKEVDNTNGDALNGQDKVVH
ncbi:MAG: hypothetical protein ACOYNY_46580, partial [Caldilineaceae bacterium]